jgi:hypothetical protein
MREKHRLRIFENRELRIIPGPEREEVMGGRRRLHEEHFLLLKVKLSLCLTKHHAMKAYWGVEV